MVTTQDKDKTKALIVTKLKKTNCNNSKNSNCDKTQKTQFVTKF